jgi:deoxycytidylate deaminase
MCAKAIINAGISRVVYCDEYRDTAGIELLNSYNIRVDKFDM